MARGEAVVSGRGKGGVRGLRPWNDYEKFTQMLTDLGVQFGVEHKGRERHEYGALPRGSYTRVAFGTTTFVFDRRGNHLGYEYMGRDEDDRFVARIPAH